MSIDESVSFWQQRSKIDRSVPTRSGGGPRIAIIGAGVVGLSVAFHLRALGYDGAIEIFEQKFIGYGATGRSGGVLVSDNVYAPGSEWDVAYIRVALRRSGIPTSIESSRGRLLGTSGEFDNDLVDPVELVLTLADHLRRREVTISEGVSVDKFRCQDGQTELLTSAGVISCEQSFLATGAYLDRFVADAIGLETYHEDCIVVEADPECIPWTFYQPLSDSDYLWGRRIGTNKILIGGGLRYTLPETSDDRRRTHTLAGAVSVHLPRLGVKRVCKVWSGRLSRFKDGKGWRVVRIPADSGMFYAGGFSDYGIAAGFRAGLLGAMMLLGQTPPALAIV